MEVTTTDVYFRALTEHVARIAFVNWYTLQKPENKLMMQVERVTTFIPTLKTETVEIDTPSINIFGDDGDY
jgi:hypothetical protein